MSLILGSAPVLPQLRYFVLDSSGVLSYYHEKLSNAKPQDAQAHVRAEMTADIYIFPPQSSETLHVRVAMCSDERVGRILSARMLLCCADVTSAENCEPAHGDAEESHGRRQRLVCTRPPPPLPAVQRLPSPQRCRHETQLRRCNAGAGLSRSPFLFLGSSAGSGSSFRSSPRTSPSCCRPSRQRRWRARQSRTRTQGPRPRLGLLVSWERGLM